MIIKNTKIDIFCIGTPSVSGDAIGPLIGSMLSLHSFNKDINIIGTLDDPVHSENYNDKLKLLRSDATIIAIDCVLSKYHLGEFSINYGSIKPGSSMNKKLTPVGDISIKCYTSESLNSIDKINEWNISMMAYKIVSILLNLLNANEQIA